jgi:hypothetical protein
VITALKTHAFKASPYPVILSLEVHCTVPQQQRMAEIMRTTLGPMVRRLPDTLCVCGQAPILTAVVVLASLCVSVSPSAGVAVLVGCVGGAERWEEFAVARGAQEQDSREG